MNLILDLHEFRCVADALGLGTLDESDDGVDLELLRAIYRHAHGDDGQRTLFQADPTFTRGWINLESARARELISPLVALDDADNLKQARRIAQSNLEAQPWNDLLGIEHPPIQCRVKIHGAKWGLRFQSASPALKGQELINEQLPPCSSEHTANAPKTQPPQRVAETHSDQPPSAEVLRRGGLPS